MKDHSATIHVQVPVDVATFLLNEKRADIHLVESRLKVNITIIPNPHMATPHYTVTRLRHDDITADHLQSSYKLVDKPAEKSAITATQNLKAQRPQAAVQGITPNQPAPKHVAIKTTSMLSNFFAWIKSFSAEEPKKQSAAATRNNPPRRDRNEGNRPETAQQQGNRQRNKPRRDKEETPRIDKPVRPEPKAQEPRKERPPRPPRVAIEKPLVETLPPVANITASEDSNIADGRKRGRRGGKRERERRDQLPAEQALNEQAFNEANGNIALAPATTVEPVFSQQQPNDGLVQVETKLATQTNSTPTSSPPYQTRRRARPREIYTLENKEPLEKIETQTDK